MEEKFKSREINLETRVEKKERKRKKEKKQSVTGKSRSIIEFPSSTGFPLRFFPLCRDPSLSAFVVAFLSSVRAFRSFTRVRSFRVALRSSVRSFNHLSRPRDK